MFRHRVFALAIVCLVATSAAADQLGSIVAKYDGEPKEWFTMSMESNGGVIGSATFREGKLTDDLHIQGLPGLRFTSKDVLSIDVGFIKPFTENSKPVVAEITHLPEGISGAIWTSERVPEQVDIQFDTLDPESGRATGSFEAKLCLAATIGAEPDTSNCRAIKGTFDTELLLE
jgi:hypothetical protein